jgi:hypothetical protein
MKDNFDLKKYLAENKLGEIKKDNYPDEISKMIDQLIQITGVKKYAWSATTAYGVWMIQLPTTKLPITLLTKISSIIPNGFIGVYPGYSGLSIKTEIPSNK